MKALSRIAPLIALLLSACVSREPAPAPAPAPRPLPAPPPATPVGEDWRDVPLTPGGWSYRPAGGGSIAQFGAVGGGAVFAIRCDAAARRIVLSRGAGAPGAPAALNFVTSFGNFAVSATMSAGQPPAVSANLAATDPNLDKLAFSRGRFIVTSAGAPRLVIPAWPEIARVVEDCRG